MFLLLERELLQEYVENPLKALLSIEGLSVKREGHSLAIAQHQHFCVAHDNFHHRVRRHPRNLLELAIPAEVVHARDGLDDLLD